jgi:hypothetical protein
MANQRDLGVEGIITEMKKELHVLYAERSAIDRRMDVIKKALVGLATLYGDEAISADFLQPVHPAKHDRRMVLAETCRSVILQSKTPLTGEEIHQQIAQRDPNLLILYKHPFASVAMALRRLAKKGQVRLVAKGYGKTEWATPDNLSPEDIHSLSEKSTPLSTGEMNRPCAPKREASGL